MEEFDKPYDEAISVSGDDASTPNLTPRSGGGGGGGHTNPSLSLNNNNMNGGMDGGNDNNMIDLNDPVNGTNNNMNGNNMNQSNMSNQNNMHNGLMGNNMDNDSNGMGNNHNEINGNLTNGMGNSNNNISGNDNNRNDNLMANNNIDGIPSDYSEGMHASPHKKTSPPNDKDNNSASANQQSKTSNPHPKSPGKNDNDSSSTSSSSEDDSPSQNSTHSASNNPNFYNPNDPQWTTHLKNKISPEIKELFQYITRYRPHSIELETKLKPFIPDFIPSIGEVDAMLKIPRPDNKPDGLGLVRLDEGSGIGKDTSDPVVLELRLRSGCKIVNKGVKEVEVRSVSERFEIKNWVGRIGDLHRTTKPQGHTSQVQYSKKMPDIESLMQVWPQLFEEYIDSKSTQIQGSGGTTSGTPTDITMPNNNLNNIHNIQGGHPQAGINNIQQQQPNYDFGLSQSSLSLQDLTKMVCTLCDIPYYEGSLTDSLHVLFTLYLEFRDNQHFQGVGLQQGGGMMVGQNEGDLNMVSGNMVVEGTGMY